MNQGRISDSLQKKIYELKKENGNIKKNRQIAETRLLQMLSLIFNFLHF